MFKRIIDASNFDDILTEIKLSDDTVFDFSGTKFSKLESVHLSDLFVTLGSLPQTFLLKLNFCEIDEQDLGHKSQLSELTLGLSVTKNMIQFEFIRSLSPDCPQMVLEKIAKSLLKNHALKSITIDGFRVTPPAVYEILKNHPTVVEMIIDGLPKVLREQKIPSGSSNEPVFNDIQSSVLLNLKRNS